MTDGVIVKRQPWNGRVWGMPEGHGGYASLAHYRTSILRFGLPYVLVTALVFTVSLVGADEIKWLTYLFGWTVALSSLALAYLRPHLWLLAPFGALGGALLIRAATDGLDSGLGPLLMIPAMVVAVYGSRYALFAMIGTITAAVIVIEIVAVEEPVLSPVWRQDAILVVLATVLAIAIQGLVTRMREERSLAAARGRQIEQLNSITKAIATSSNGGRALCTITTDVTEAVGAALFRLADDGTLKLIAWQNGRREMLGQIGSGPALVPQSVLKTNQRVQISANDAEMNLHRMAWEGSPVGTVIWEPVPLNGDPIGVLALAYGPEWENDHSSLIPIDLLAAEGTIAIQQNLVTEQLRTLATTDPLTGIDNRRGWEREIEREIKRAQRMEQPLCVALLDLDHFKKFNDTFGHMAGDRLLTESAQKWQGLMRAGDHIARYGGEEFVITLPGTNLEFALEVIERLRAAVPRKETCSAGVAQWNGEESIEELLQRADEALYLAKENGRNMLMADGPPEPD